MGWHTKYRFAKAHQLCKTTNDGNEQPKRFTHRQSAHQNQSLKRSQEHASCRIVSKLIAPNYRLIVLDFGKTVFSLSFERSRYLNRLMLGVWRDGSWSIIIWKDHARLVFYRLLVNCTWFMHWFRFSSERIWRRYSVFDLRQYFLST